MAPDSSMGAPSFGYGCGPAPGNSLSPGWHLLLRTQLIWTVAVAALWGVGLLLLPLDPDYTAGELLDHLLWWRGSGTLYSDPSVLPHRVLNYPPLFLALVRGLAGLGIPPLMAGRILGSAGVALALWVVYQWLRELGVGPSRAGMGMGLVGSSFPLLYSFGQFHLEGFAAAATLAGFWLAGRGGRWVLLAGVVLALGCFFKQTQVVLSLVALGWIGVHRPWREFGMALGAYGMVGILGSGIITLAFGMAAWRHMLTYTVGTFSMVQLGLQQASFTASWLIFLGAALWSMKGTKDRWTDPRSWYLLGSALWTLSALRQGSSYAYFLDLHLAVLLWVIPLLARPSAPKLRRLLALQMVVGSGVVGGVLAYDLLVVSRTAQALPAICGALEAGGFKGAGETPQGVAPSAATGSSAMPSTAGGYLVSGSPGLARACGRVPALHPFITASLARQGLWSPAPFHEALAGGEFGRILLSFDPEGGGTAVERERWTREALSIFRDRYRGVGVWAGWRVLEPVMGEPAR